MGLSVSHKAWSGSYNAFHRWRRKIAQCIGIPLVFMEGFYENLLVNPLEHNEYKEYYTPGLPVRWELLKPDPLHILLSHSDCDGEIAWENCLAIAKRLEEIIPMLPKEKEGWGHIDDWKETTQKFIDGCKLAYSNKEPLEFY